jgi:hypothetical protein
MAHSLSEQRLIENEATQRTENEKARRTLVNIITSDDVINFICECSDDACGERIALTNHQFLDLHRNSREFVIKPGHQTVAIEKVVAETPEYFIVRKHTDPGTYKKRP